MFVKTDIKPFESKVWLASPTMHGEEIKYINEAYETNWMSTVGANINEVERIAAEKAEMKYAVALSCCTAALHLCCKFAGEKLYGKPAISHGALEGKRVFCSDMTFDATLNPVVYEGGIPVFIDTEAESWNMDPVALEKAFELYPEVKLVVCAELYGFPGRIDEIKRICEKHGALLIEDAAEAMGATVDGRQCGSFGDYSAISYNGNKIITGSAGGCLLTNDIEVANKARKWSTQAREAAAWYQHEEVGYNYRMHSEVTNVPKGSGLGTSSILSAAAVKAMLTFCGIPFTDDTLYATVLAMEQIMSTGGGWQDQVGGVTPGIKFITSFPGIDQKIKVEKVEISEETKKELNDRFCLIYTGQRRLARNLLRDVVGRYVGNEPDSLTAHKEMRQVKQTL